MRIHLSWMLSILFVTIIAACSTADKKTNDKTESIPKLTKPIVKKIWVPDEIRDNEFISGHWKYLLSKEPTWSK